MTGVWGFIGCSSLDGYHRNAMSILPAGDSLPLTTRLSIVYDVAREMSRHADPQAMLLAYRQRMRPMMPFDRTISLSRRGLTPRRYKITRSDLWEDEINPWKEPELIPEYEGGLLGTLLWEGQVVLQNDFTPELSDPAYDHLAGMRSLVAIPHFDEGEALNMAVHLCRERGAFSPEELPDFMLLSSLFGRTTRTLTLMENLKKTDAKIKLQNETLQLLSDTVIDQALSLKDHATSLESRVRSRTAELHEAHLETIFMLAAACEAKDADTGAHVRRIQKHTCAVAHELGLHGDAEAIGYASILHDVGKMHIPDDILQKPGKLSDDERRIMQTHTLAGERILGETSYFATARLIARSHHENFDGSGYPDGAAGEQIPIAARIVRVADFFDAVTSRRVYKDAWPIGQALDALRTGAGQLFDPAVVRAFLSTRRETDSTNRRVL